MSTPVQGDGKWHVQTGKGQSRYVDRYVLSGDKAAMAYMYFNGLNVHSGYKKRLIDPDGKIVARILT